MIKIYSYSACGTCRKALKWLNDHGLKYELIEILTNPPSREVLEEAISQYASKKPLFNTSGASYRNIGAEKIKAMNNQEGLNLLASDSKLIKRPVLITDQGIILIGFKKELWEEKLMQ